MWFGHVACVAVHGFKAETKNNTLTTIGNVPEISPRRYIAAQTAPEDGSYAYAEVLTDGTVCIRTNGTAGIYCSLCYLR